MTVSTLKDPDTAQCTPRTNSQPGPGHQLEGLPTSTACNEDCESRSFSHSLPEVQDSFDEGDEIPDPESLVGYIRKPFGRKYNIVEIGDPDNSKYAIRAVSPDGPQSDTEINDQLDRNEKVTCILGVANYVPPKFAGHLLDLLNPERWFKQAPLTKVKIETSNGRLLWVDRDDVRNHWSGGDHLVALKENFRIGDYVVLKRGQVVRRTDLNIAKRAVEAEVNFQHWQMGKCPIAITEDSVPGESNEIRSQRAAKAPEGENSSMDVTSWEGINVPGRLPREIRSRMAFDAIKEQLARNFLAELDHKVTQGKIAAMTESTGGVKVNWNKLFKSTAGRANFKRETIRTKHPDGTVIGVRHKYYASIDLAEKVVDDSSRLLNTVAHEFCHLATYMVTGIINNPHGKEFKSWAAKCSRAFPDHGIQITTKHSYEIDFKYVWECMRCGQEYKRHTRCIDPVRQSCGKCRHALKQTRPATWEGR